MERGLSKEEVQKLENIFEIPKQPKLDYTWVAYFEDGSMFRQYDNVGDDAANFKEVMRRHTEDDNLVEFELRGGFLKHKIKVNLRTGVITVNKQEFLPYIEDEPVPVGAKFHLEYFRRSYTTRGVSVEGKDLTPTKYKKWQPTYYIGWSFLWTKDKLEFKRYKRLVRIYFDGKLGIG